MAGYKERLTRDLDRWVGAGLVSADQRAALLADVPDSRRLDAASALVWVGGVLAGMALIAFVAANWDGLPRLARFAMVLGVFAATGGGAAWSASAGRPNLANGLLTFAAVSFAAAIGLTGQIFDLTGEPRTALLASGVVAAALALAGGSSGAAVAALVFIGAADWLYPLDIFDFGQTARGFPEPPWLLLAAPLAALFAVRWRSAALAHAASVAALSAAIGLAARWRASPLELLGIAVVLAGLAAAARWWRGALAGAGGVFEGWLAWGAMGFFVIAGFGPSASAWRIPHRIVWLLIAGGLIALGRNDRRAAITTLGVLSLIGAISALLVDLGLSLLAAAGVFLLAAILAAVAGLILRRRPA